MFPSVLLVVTRLIGPFLGIRASAFSAFGSRFVNNHDRKIIRNLKKMASNVFQARREKSLEPSPPKHDPTKAQQGGEQHNVPRKNQGQARRVGIAIENKAWLFDSECIFKQTVQFAWVSTPANRASIKEERITIENEVCFYGLR